MFVPREAAEIKSQSLLERACIIIPTFNASEYLKPLLSSLEAQGVHNQQVLIVDSSSTDNTRELVEQAGYRLRRIPKEDFRHGATRQMASGLTNSDYVIFLTQDALPVGKDCFVNLLAAFEDPEIGAAYGRQLAWPDADPIDRHARLFNYPESSAVRSFADRERIGFRAAFFSNSFAAYRRCALEQVGGFPTDAIVSEEVSVAARLLMQDWKIAYQGDAEVLHSHHMTMRQEFRRYFDIGVHHGNAAWLIKAFGGPGGEGRAFVFSQMRYLKAVKPLSIPEAFARNVGKWVAYQLGVRERALPTWLKLLLSAQSEHWHDEAGSAIQRSHQAGTARNDLADNRYK
jgi:rhamnosyltransferase